jgi:hypothetical protein
MLDNFAMVTENETYIVKALPNNTMKIMPNTPETYRKLIHHVRDEKIIHHTYRLKQGRAYRIVILDLHHSIPMSDMIEEFNKKGHKVRNMINVKHRVSKEPLPLSFVDLEPQSNNKEIFNLKSFCKTAKSMLNHPDAKQISYNVQDAKIRATQKHIVQSHSTVLNAVDRMIRSPVRKPEIPQLNVSFAVEAILLIIKAALYIVI